MNYLTQYYKNLSEQLQEKIKFMQHQLDEATTEAQRTFEKEVMNPSGAYTPIPVETQRTRDTDSMKVAAKKAREEADSDEMKLRTAENVGSKALGGVGALMSVGALGIAASPAIPIIGASTLGLQTGAAFRDALIDKPIRDLQFEKNRRTAAASKEEYVKAAAEAQERRAQRYGTSQAKGY
jgi:hypothetical protein